MRDVGKSPKPLLCAKQDGISFVRVEGQAVGEEPVAEVNKTSLEFRDKGGVICNRE